MCIIWAQVDLKVPFDSFTLLYKPPEVSALRSELIHITTELDAELMLLLFVQTNKVIINSTNIPKVALLKQFWSLAF